MAFKHTNLAAVLNTIKSVDITLYPWHKSAIKVRKFLNYTSSHRKRGWNVALTTNIVNDGRAPEIVVTWANGQVQKYGAEFSCHRVMHDTLHTFHRMEMWREYTTPETPEDQVEDTGKKKKR